MKKLKKLFALFALFAVFAVCTVHAQDRHVVYSGNSIPIVTNNFFSTYTSVSQVFIFTVPTNDTVQLYVTNYGGSTHAMTVQVFGTGLPFVADYTNNTSAWAVMQTQIVPNGTFAVSQTLSLPAGSTTVVGTPITSSTQIAVKISATSNSTDLFSLNGVIGTYTPVGNQVQGTIAPGATATTDNPFLAGFIDSNNHMCAVGTGSCLTTGALIGLPVGSADATSGSYGQYHLPAGQIDGPLATVMFTQPNDSNGASPLYQSGGSPQSFTVNPGGLWTADAGYYFNASTTVVTTGSVISFFTPPQYGAFDACYVTLESTEASGSAPTLNAYFQTSNDGLATGWTDRISFLQMTTGSLNQTATISAQGTGIAPTANQNEALAAGSVVNGPLGRYAQIIFVVGGTGGSWTVRYGVNCH